MSYRILKSLLFFFIVANTYAQLDEIHYLPPLKQGGNNQGIREQAIYLSTPEVVAFDVKVYRGNEVNAIATITGLVNGTPKEYALGNGDNGVTLVTNANTGKVISNAGLRFESTGGQKFYVNWRGRSGAQAGSLTCKGRKSLGRDFRWGGIPARATQASCTNSLGIMATVDGTVVTLSGYDLGCRFTGFTVADITDGTISVNLNKGQTVVIEAKTNVATANQTGWIGATIRSNNLIATSVGGLNVGIRSGANSRDVGMDQPVPTNVLGREYVFIRGNGQDESEFPIIVATQNGTEIKVGGTVLTTINNGEFFEIPGNNYSLISGARRAGSSMFVETSKDAYAFQCLTGRLNAIQTIGMNFIAPVNCLLPSVLSEIPEIQNVAGTPAGTRSFEGAVTIIAATTTPDSFFTVTENGVAIPSSRVVSAPVPGTTEWKSFYIDGLEDNISITSTGGGFAAGFFLTDNSNAGMAGYFSGFDTTPQVEIDINGGGCFPGLALVEKTGGFDFYQWFKDGSIIPGATGSSYIPTTVGDYYVLVTKTGCSYPSAVLSTYYCDPDIVITKTADVNTIEEGDEVEFTIRVDSRGIDPITNLELTDVLPIPLTLVSATPSKGTFVSPVWSVGTMDSGEIQSIDIVATAPVGSEGGVTVKNLVSHTQDQVDSDRTLDDLEEDVAIKDGEINLTKSSFVNDGGDGTVDVGDMVTFQFEVSNGGQLALSNIVLNDPLLGGNITVAPTGDNNNNSILEVGEVWRYSVNHSITQIEINAGQIINAATVRGTQPNGSVQNDNSDDPNDNTDIDDNGDGEPDDDTVTLLGESPGINLVKTGLINDGGDGVQVGDTIDYTLTLTNTGNVILDNIIVNDPLLGGNIGAPSSGDDGDSILQLNETWVYNRNYTITATNFTTGSVTNSATVSAKSPGDNDVEDVSDDPSNPTDVDPNMDDNPDDPTVILIPKSDVAITMSPNTKQLCVGEKVEFTITVSNQSLLSDTGTVSATGISVNSLLPIGYQYESHTVTSGVYNNASGLWTVPSIAKQDNEILKIVATAKVPTGATNEYLNRTEITALDQFDVDSNVLVSFGVDDLTDGTTDDDESEFTLTVTEVPVITLGTVSQISMCGLTDGSIEINGLKNSESYDVSYIKDGATVNSTATSNGSGTIILNNLPSGAYTNIQASQNGCLSNALAGPIDIAEPVTPLIAIDNTTNPTTCEGTEGTIVISGLVATNTYQVDYTKDGAALSASLTADGSGNVTITGLSAAGYDDIQLTIDNCESNILGPIALTDPTAPTIALGTITHPTSCGGTGTIEITGAAASTNYDINYIYNGTSSMVNLTSNGSGVIDLLTLGAGSYTNISVTNSNCTSNTISFAVINPPVISLGTVTQPTTCGGTGSFTIEGLVGNEAYDISYELDAGSPILTNLTADATGLITVPNLAAGTYADIKAITSIGCVSNSLASAVTITALTPPTITIDDTMNTTSCILSDGTIEIGGLMNSQSYQVNYDFDTTAISPISVASNNSGKITLTGLAAGSYTNIKVTNTTTLCESNTVTATIVEPTAPNAPVVNNQGFCDSATIADLTGTVDVGNELIWYDLATGGSVLTDATSLANGISYYAVAKNTITDCESTRSVVLVDIFNSPIISNSVPNNPTTCAGNDGSIVLEGLISGNTYLVDFSKDGVAQTQLSLTADTSGEITIPNLSEGIYGSVITTLNNCSSAPTGTITLTDPPLPVISSVAGNNPTTCSGTEGSLIVSGLNSGDTYLVDYTKDGVAQAQTSLTADGSGNVTILALGAGVYNNVIVTINDCSSLPSSVVTLVDPALPSVPVVSDESLCDNPTIADLTGTVQTGESLLWYNVATGGTPLLSTTVVVTGIYYASAQNTSTNCESGRSSINVSVFQSPVVSGIMGNNPTTCLGMEGSVVVSGLINGNTYLVDYTKDGLAQTQLNLAANADGDIIIPNLNSGVYASVVTTLNNCSSSPSGSVTLVDPTTPVISGIMGSNPTTCSGTEGSVVVSGLTSGNIYTVAYEKDNIAQPLSSLTADGSGNITIPTLGAGVYGNVTVTINSCESSPSSAVTLTDPAIPVISGIVGNDPTTCSGTEGSVVVSGLTSGSIYSVAYEKDNAAQTALTLTADTSGNITIPTLGAGVYGNIVTTINNCDSAPSSVVTLTDPALPVISGIVGNDPTTCSGTEGSVVVSGLTSGSTYSVAYEKDSAAQTALTLTADASGNITIPTLGAGVYGNIVTTINNCDSAPSSAVTLTDPAIPVISGIVGNNPTTCSGIEGSVVVSGLTNGSTYSVAYEKDSAAQTALTLTADTSGNITIPNLGAGVYGNIVTTINNCDSAPSSAVTLTDPALPVINGILGNDPTTCSGTEGSVVVSGLTNGSTYSIAYEKDSAAQTALTLTADAIGNITIPNLGAGVYGNIVTTINNCDSLPSGTVTLTDPVLPLITLGTVTQISACGSTDGGIEINGLENNETYSFSYTKDGAAVNTTANSNASGIITLTNLPIGVYSNFEVTINNCTSAILTDSVTIEEPATPVIVLDNNTNPTTCSGSDGTITLSGLNTTTSYTVDYLADGSAVNTSITSDGSGNLIITGLSAGNYSDIQVTLANCPSNILSGAMLNDPIAPTIVLDKVNDPTTCDGVGSIEFTGLVANETYGVDYQLNSVPTFRTVIADGTGRLILQTLGAGSYENISVTVDNCTSNTITFAVINPPVISLGNVMQSTTCLGTGSFEITGLVANETYDINYNFNSVNTTNNLTADGSGVILVSGLLEGTYSGIKAITSIGCESNTLANIVFTDPVAPVITLGTITDPNSCVVDNGSIQITGLTANTNYTLNYISPSGTVSNNVASNGVGEILVTDLAEGTYSGIQVIQADTLCESNILNTDLSLPASPNDPTVSAQDFCGPMTIGDLTGTVDTGHTLIWYEAATGGSPLIGTTALSTTTYYAVAQHDVNLCESNRVAVAVRIKEIPVAVLKSSSDPTTCMGTEGDIVLENVNANTAYIVNYEFNGNAVVSNISSDVSGEITISNLAQGNYTNITLDLEDCISNALSVMLTDPDLPVIALGTTTQISLCDSTDGDIEITGLTSGTAYQLTYLKDAAMVNTTLTADTSGNINITNLPIGTYSDFQVTVNNCISNVLTGSINIEEPITALIALDNTSNPTTCGGTDGDITLSGGIAAVVYTVDYLKNGTAVSETITADTSGNIVVANLSADNYTDFNITSDNCTSNTLSGVSLSDPMTPVLTLDQVNNPTVCGGTGSLEFIGLNPNTTYGVAYNYNGTPTTDNITTDNTGRLIMITLGSGVYQSINVTLAGCMSNSVNYAVINPPVISLGNTTQPTTCGGTGSFEINGLGINETYTINYLLAGANTTSAPMTSDATGQIVFSGLLSGVYTNIKVITDILCESNEIANVTLVDPANPVIALQTETDPNSCIVDNGAIVLSGLIANHNYELSYISPSGNVSNTVASDSAGTIQMNNLAAGAYTAIQVEDVLTTCVSNVLISTLVLPPTPDAPVVNVTQEYCDMVTVLELPGTVNTDEELIWYDVLTGGSPLASNTSLSTGTYYAVAKNSNTDCESSRTAVEVTIFITPIITSISGNNPTTCSGTEGNVIASGLINGSTYLVDYSKDGVAQTALSIPADASGNVTIPNLGAGVYADIAATLNNCTSDALSSVTLTDPSLPLITGLVANDPTTCLGTEGSIVVSGLINGSTYSVAYEKDSVAQTVLTLTADASGNITISSLGAGVYGNIVTTINNCNSLPSGTVTLTDPALPVITGLVGNNPTTCSGVEGSVVVSGLTSGSTYSVAYEKDNAAQTALTLTADASGNITIPSLGAGVYGNIVTTINNCDSLPSSTVTLTDPAIPVISGIIGNDPTTCSGIEGSVVVSGLTSGNTYGVAYEKDNAAQTILTLTADASGNITIPSLGAGVYGNIVTTINNCDSVPSSTVILSDPAIPVITLGTVTPISACGSTDGGIEINGLENNETYSFSYTKDGAAVNTTANSNASGMIALTNLPIGVYSNFEVTINNCTSAILTDSVTIEEPATPVIVLDSNSNPTTCSGADGTITLSGLEADTTYTIDYLNSGTNINTLITSENDGTLEISSLSAGNYSDIQVTLANCPSNILSGVILNDPIAPTIVLDTVNHPTTCDGVGSLEFTGLVANETYEINYQYNTVPDRNTVTADGTGRLILQTLGAGSYENISVTVDNCTSNTITFAVINPPVISLGNVVQPSICDGTGSLEITGLVVNEPYTVNYDFNGTNTNVSLTADATGVMVVPNLLQGTYANVKVITTTNCESNALVDVVLTDPVKPVIGLGTITNPNSCVIDNGSIEITGLTANTNYTLTYTSPSGAVTNNVAADASGFVLVSDLAEGVYTAIKVVQVSTLCESNILDTELILPALPEEPVVTNQDFCGPMTIVDLAGIVDTGHTLIWYDNLTGGIPLLASTALTTKTYYAVSINNTNQCESARVAVEVLIKEIPVAVLQSSTNPTTCAGNEGAIVLENVNADTLYRVTYKLNGVPVLANILSDVLGNITIDNLTEGVYTEIQLDLQDCVSNTLEVTLVDPPLPNIALGNVTQISACDSTDAAIEITGLTAGETYGLSYVKDGAAVNTTMLADTNGFITLVNLPIGSYADFQVSINNCDSNILSGTFNIDEPITSVISLSSINNPTTCAGTDGSITLSGAEADTVYTVDYLKNGGMQNETITSSNVGEIVLTNLNAASYTDINITSLNCTSNNLTGTSLADPMTPTIVLDKVNDPTVCGGTGSLEFVGLAADTNYQVDYIENGVTTIKFITANNAGRLTLTTLDAGLYESIRVTIAGCTSNSINYAVINPPVISLENVNQPTTCEGMGSVEMSGLRVNDTYTVSYLFNGMLNTSAPITADDTGLLIFDGLLAGTYTDVKVVTNIGCESNSLASIQIEDPILPTLVLQTVTNPNSCIVDNGSMILSGLIVNHNYTLSYNSPTGNVTDEVATDSNGSIQVNDLAEGAYTAIQVIDKTTDCTSNIISTTLVLPATPTDPTVTAVQDFCGSGLVIDLEATVNAGEDLRWYTSLINTTPVNISDALISGTYYAVAKNQLTDCESNRIAVQVNVNPCANVGVTKVVDNDAPNVGDVLTFELLITNDGPDLATGVMIQDVLPVGFTYVVNSVSHGAIKTGNILDWNNLVIPLSGLTLTYQVEVNAPTGVADEYKNTAQLISVDQVDENSNPGNDDGDQSEDDESAVITVPQSINLNLTITQNDQSLDVNQEIIFVVTVQNSGTDTATDVDIQSLIPEGYTFVSSSTGSYDNTTNLITWSNVIVSPSGQVIFTFIAKVNEPTDINNIEDEDYLVTAEVIGVNQFDINSTPANDDGDQSEDDEDNTTAKILIADLGIEKTISKKELIAGETIQFTLEVTNFGPDTATGVEVIDQLPVGYTYVGHRSGSYNSSTGVWMIDEILKDEKAILIIDAVVNPSSDTVGEYDNTANIGSLNQFDGDTSTNASTATATLSMVDLRISKTVDKTKAKINEEVVFTVTLDVLGDVEATNVKISEQIPSGYEYVSHTQTIGNYDESDGIWAIAIAPANTQQVLTITATINALGDHVNVAEIVATDQVNTNPTVSANASVEAECLTLYQLFTPNGDGANETLVIDCIDQYPNNTLEIYNRYGNIVYSKKGYNNSFEGISNGRLNYREEFKLPVGTYFYILDLGEGSKPAQGWLYINR